MKVMKFGGSSIGSAESILKVKQIVESIEEPVIVVISALGGVTDQLLTTSKLASQGDSSYEKEYNQLVVRHLEMVKNTIVDEAKCKKLSKEISGLLGELGNILRGVFLVKDLSQKTSDIVVSYGERLSSLIFVNLLTNARLFDARNFIQTEKQFKKHIVDFPLTNRLIEQTFVNLPHISVVPGFISSDKNTGDITNLGRGGSDYTASILAATLKARILEIWTDVDGFMTADPRIISNAYVIEELSYVEAMELSNFGAKVIYPPTIFPAYHLRIPILIKNTFNPEAPGTYITHEKRKSANGKSIKGISSINDTSLITVRGL
jgi:aspartokinase/homoserine dehydrogenase 1